MKKIENFKNMKQKHHIIKFKEHNSKKLIKNLRKTIMKMMKIIKMNMNI